jgi:hypothetical protein
MKTKNMFFCRNSDFPLFLALLAVSMSTRDSTNTVVNKALSCLGVILDHHFTKKHFNPSRRLATSLHQGYRELFVRLHLALWQSHDETIRFNERSTVFFPQHEAGPSVGITVDGRE